MKNACLGDSPLPAPLDDDGHISPANRHEANQRETHDDDGNEKRDRGHEQDGRLGANEKVTRYGKFRTFSNSD
jgi:hypothetical protein